MKLTMRVLGFLSWTFLILSGCSELGQIGLPGDYSNLGGSDLVGEVRDVDTRARQIELSTDTGRKFLLKYDNNTRVSYRQRDLRRRQPGTGRLCGRARATRSGRSIFHRSDHSERKRAGTGWLRRNQQRQWERRTPRKLEGRVESVDSAGAHSRFATVAIGWWLFHCRTTPRAR